jgi:hypothetical protein
MVAEILLVLSKKNKGTSAMLGRYINTGCSTSIIDRIEEFLAFDSS